MDLLSASTVTVVTVVMLHRFWLSKRDDKKAMIKNDWNWLTSMNEKILKIREFSLAYCFMWFSDCVPEKASFMYIALKRAI